MKLTVPQMRVLTNIIIAPEEAQREIDAKLSARNVFDNLVKVGALVEVTSYQAHESKRNLLNTRVTKAGWDVAGIMLKTSELSAMQATVLTDVIDNPERLTAETVNAQLANYAGTIPVHPDNAGSEMAQAQIEQDIKAYLDAIEDRPSPAAVIELEREAFEDVCAGSDDRTHPSSAHAMEAQRVGRRVRIDGPPITVLDCGPTPDELQAKLSTIEGLKRIPAQRMPAWLPMPEIDPADEPIPLVPAKLITLTVGTGNERARKKNMHTANENPVTKSIACQCGIKTKSRTLLAMLHQTTRIRPTVTEV